MNNQNFTLDDVETLRAKTGVSYEEAISLLEKYDGDMARCLIELEKRGELHNKPGFDLGDTLTDLWHRACSTNVVVERGDKLIADLPVIYLALALILSWKLVLVTALIALVLSCRVRISTPDQTDKPSDPPAPQPPQPKPASHAEVKEQDGFKTITIE